jgi:hypothetical protein
MAWPLLAAAAPYLIGGAMGVGMTAAGGKTDWKSLLFGGLTGAASGGMGAGMFGGGAGAAGGGSGIGAGTGGAGGAGGWWSKPLSSIGGFFGGGSPSTTAGAGGIGGGYTPPVSIPHPPYTGPMPGSGGSGPYSTPFPQNIPDISTDPKFFEKAFPGGTDKLSPNMKTGKSGLWSEEDGKTRKSDLSSEEDGKTSAKVEQAQAPSSSGSTRGGGTSASIGGGDLGGFNFASAPGISPVSLPQRSATFDPGFKSLSSSSGLSQGGSPSRYTPQTGMNPTLQRILAGYAKDRRGYA